MNKREFLDLLRYYLRAYPHNMINDIVADYEEHFHIGMEKGKTEEQISAELGSPKDIADEFLNSQTPPRPNYHSSCTGKNEHNNRKKRTSVPVLILIILAALFIGPTALGVLLAILGSALAIVLSLITTMIALAVSGVATLFANFVPIQSYIGIAGYTPHILTSLFLGIFLIGLAILFGFLIIYVVKLCVNGLKKLYLAIRWKLLKRRNE